MELQPTPVVTLDAFRNVGQALVRDQLLIEVIADQKLTADRLKPFAITLVPDARCLADRLKDAEHPIAALWLYEQERLPVTAQIVRMNRKGGPEGVIDVVEHLAPDGFNNIDDVLSYKDREAIVRGYASTAGFLREQVNVKDKAA